MEGEAEVLGELARRRVAQHRGGGDDDGRVAGRRPMLGQQHVDVVGVLEVDPGVRQLDAGGEGPQRHGLGASSATR